MIRLLCMLTGGHSWSYYSPDLHYCRKCERAARHEWTDTEVGAEYVNRFQEHYTDDYRQNFDMKITDGVVIRTCRRCRHQPIEEGEEVGNGEG